MPCQLINFWLFGPTLLVGVHANADGSWEGGLGEKGEAILVVHPPELPR